MALFLGVYGRIGFWVGSAGWGRFSGNETFLPGIGNYYPVVLCAFDLVGDVGWWFALPSFPRRRESRAGVVAVAVRC